MKKSIKCPYCSKYIKIFNQKIKFTYRKKIFEVDHYFYKCDKCNKEFTTIETDTNTISQVHNKYKKSKKI